MVFIQLMGVDGEPIAINVDHIQFFNANGTGTELSVGDSVIHVQDSYDVIKAVLAENK